jgi:amino-acid N-acetyltransferase
LEVEKARLDDAPQIHRLVNFWAERGEMLPRSLSEIYENLRDYWVVHQGQNVAACVAFHIYWSDLAEIRALAVREDNQAAGLGSRLVDTCIGEARGLGIPVIFALTYRPGFFERFNFQQVPVERLPRKVWGECQHCPKFPNCDETALVLPLKPVPWLRRRRARGVGLA